jgi:hypothetical protein
LSFVLDRKECLCTYATHILQRNVSIECNHVTHDLADYHCHEQQYLNDLAFIIKSARVDTETFTRDYRSYRLEKSAQASIFENIGKINIGIKRPSMRATLQLKRASASRSGVNNDKIQVHNLDMFITAVQFPHGMNMTCKQICYVFAYHPCLDYSMIPDNFLPSDVRKRVAEYTACIPDLPSLITSISVLQWTGPPFSELNTFKDLVWQFIPHSQKSHLSWSRLFQLYVVTYLDKTIWQRIWVGLLPILSAQMIKEIGDFGHVNPFNYNAFTKTIDNKWA